MTRRTHVTDPHAALLATTVELLSDTRVSVEIPIPDLPEAGGRSVKPVAAATITLLYTNIISNIQ